MICLGTLLNRAGSLVIPFLALYLESERGLTADRASWVVGSYGVGSFLGTMVGGHLADEIGRRPVMVGSLLGAAGVLAALSHVDSLPLLVAAVVLLSTVADAYRPASMAMIGDLVPTERREHAFGLLYVAINLGFSAAPLLGGFLAARSYSLLFLVNAASCAAYGIILLAAVPETLPAAGAGPRVAVPWSAAVRAILRDRVFLLFLGATLAAALVFMQHMAPLPLFMKRAGLGPDTYGRVISLNGLMIVALQLPVTAWITRWPRGRMLMVAALLIGAGFGLTGVAVLPVHFAATVAVWTLGEIIQAPLTNAAVSDLAPIHLRARYMSAMALCYSLSVVVGAPLGGMALEHLGGGALWWGCAGMGVVSAALYALTPLARRGSSTQHEAVIPAPGETR